MASGDGTRGVMVGVMVAPAGMTASGLTSCAPVTGIVFTMVITGSKLC